MPFYLKDDPIEEMPRVAADSVAANAQQCIQVMRGRSGLSRGNVHAGGATGGARKKASFAAKGWPRVQDGKSHFHSVPALGPLPTNEHDEWCWWFFFQKKSAAEMYPLLASRRRP